MTDEMFKPGYEGERPSTVLTAPERQTLRLGKIGLVTRLHDAMLTLCAMESMAALGVETGGVPAHIVEFADRVGEAKAEVELTRFKPTAAQVSALDKSLTLLEGLKPDYFKVVLLRALYDFARKNAEESPWTWEAIGGYFGMSERWAESMYDRAVIQAARRAGILPMVARHHAVLVASAWVDGMWISNISAGEDPRQALANLRIKSPVRITQASAIWVAGQPLAKRIAKEGPKLLMNLKSHGAWYKAHPDTVVEHLTRTARDIGADWMLDDLVVGGREAA